MQRKVVQIQRKIQEDISKEVYCREWRSSIILEGEVESWDKVIASGKMAAKYGYKGVVNNILVKNLEVPQIKLPCVIDRKLEGKKVDVLIIGGGIIGTSIARELSKWDVSILLVEKECDLAMHASSKNNGMIHPGIEPHVGSKKSVFNVRGNELYTKITKELDVPFRRCGSTVLFYKNILKLGKPYLINRAKRAGVKGMDIVKKDRVKELEPNLNDCYVGAVHFSTVGVLSPYKMTIAFGENAATNGVEFSFDTVVLSMKKEKEKIIWVETNRGRLFPTIVINAAGIYSDMIAEMAGDRFFTIHPRKGNMIIFDGKKGYLLNGVIGRPSLSLAKGNTKGGGIVKTIDGNILVGPDAYEHPFKEDYSTDRDKIERIISTQLPILKGLNKGDLITYYAGTRAATYEEDFIIERSEYVDNLVHVAGIQSPGVASAPAIAEEVEKIACGILREYMKVIKKQNWNPYRKGIPELKHMNFKERAELIKIRPDYGEIVCRCEEISKGEIVDALNSPLSINTIDGIKRRVRPGMGRCQGGFCTPHVMKIIKEVEEIEFKDITKKGANSKILVEEVQEVYRDSMDKVNEEEINEYETNNLKLQHIHEHERKSQEKVGERI